MPSPIGRKNAPTNQCATFWIGSSGTARSGSTCRFAAIVCEVLKVAQREAQQAGHAESDFRPFRFHDLRHRHAVDWLKAGRNIYDLQKGLGHSSIKTTEYHLEHLTAEEERRVKYAGAQIGAPVQRFGDQQGA